MSAPHSDNVPKDRLPVTEADLNDISENIIPRNAATGHPFWVDHYDLSISPDGPEGLTAYSTRPLTYGVGPNIGSEWVDVNPDIPYRLSFWAKADKPGSVFYLEYINQQGVRCSTYGVAPNGQATPSSYFIVGLNVPTEWTYYEIITGFTSITSRAYFGRFMWNHTNGTATDAVQSIAGLRLEPAYVREDDPRLTDSREPKAHTHSVAGLDASGRTNANFLRGDNTWATPTNTTYTVMSEAEATAGTATTARTTSAAGLKGAIQRWATGTYSTAISSIGQALNRAATAADARTAIGAAADSHTHTTAQVTGLDSALSGKAATSHTHTTAQVTGLDSALAGKVIASGATTTLWTGSQSAYDSLPTATRNAIGFIAVIV